MPAIVNTKDKWLSPPLIRRLCQGEKCQSTRCFKKKSPVRPRYKYDKNCQSGSSSEKVNPDPKRQIIYEANEAPSTEVVKEYKPGCDQYEAESQEKLQVKQITSTGTTENTNEVQMKVQMKIQSLNQAIKRDAKTQKLEL